VALNAIAHYDGSWDVRIADDWRSGNSVEECLDEILFFNVQVKSLEVSHGVLVSGGILS
jgi:hypothetical protein